MQEHGIYSIRKSGRGLVITIPQEWADDNGIKAKDRLIIRSNDGKLILSKERQNV